MLMSPSGITLAEYLAARRHNGLIGGYPERVRLAAELIRAYTETGFDPALIAFMNPKNILVEDVTEDKTKAVYASYRITLPSYALDGAFKNYAYLPREVLGGAESITEQEVYDKKRIIKRSEDFPVFVYSNVSVNRLITG